VSIQYLKRAAKSPESETATARAVVEQMLAEIARNGEAAVRDLLITRCQGGARSGRTWRHRVRWRRVLVALVLARHFRSPIDRLQGDASERRKRERRLAISRAQQKPQDET
jgi:hypothetical protein